MPSAPMPSAPAPLAPAATGTRPRVRSFAPREHGAYGQLAVPLVAAFAMGRPTLGAALFALATAAAFAAHEPLLVLLGVRGSRARREDGLRASRRVAALSLAGAVALALAWAHFPAAARLSSALPAVLAALVGWAIVARAERSGWGEVAAASALSAAAVPVAVASGVSLAFALAGWTVWTLGFAAATGAVRAAVGHHARREGLLAVAACAVLTGCAFELFRRAASVAAAQALWAVAPLLLCAAVLAARPPAPRALRKVGWLLVAASSGTAAWLITVARLSG